MGHNRWHPDIPAVVSVNPGDVFRIECKDWTDGQIKNDDSPDSEYLVFEGISVDEFTGQQYYLDAHVAYRRACLNAIELQHQSIASSKMDALG